MSLEAFNVTRYIDVPEGRIAYSDAGGAGTPVVLVPGLGNLRATFRFVVPLLLRGGARAIALDLRGHGESSLTFSSYTAADVGADVVALLRALRVGEAGVPPAIVLGNSLGAGAAVWAAAEHPTAVQSLVLEGPFVRDAKVGCFAALALSLALKRPWGPASWKMVRELFLVFDWAVWVTIGPVLLGVCPRPSPGTRATSWFVCFISL